MHGLARIGDDELKIIRVLAHRGHRAIGFLDDAIELFARFTERGSRLVQVVKRALQILHVALGQGILIEPGNGRVDILHGGAEVAHERSAFPRQIVHAGLARSIKSGILRHKRRRPAGRHGHIDETVA